MDKLFKTAIRHLTFTCFLPIIEITGKYTWAVLKIINIYTFLNIAIHYVRIYSIYNYW